MHPVTHRRACGCSNGGLHMHASITAVVCAGFAVFGLAHEATAQPMAKAQVASVITRVENGVDDFRNYLGKRGEKAGDANAAAQSSGRRKGKGGTENQKAKATAKKDEL